MNKLVIEYTLHENHIAGFVLYDNDFLKENLQDTIQEKYDLSQVWTNYFSVPHTFLQSEYLFKKWELTLDEETVPSGKVIKQWFKEVTDDEVRSFIEEYKTWKPERLSSFNQFYESMDIDLKSGEKDLSWVLFMVFDNHISLIVKSHGAANLCHR